MSGLFDMLDSMQQKQLNKTETGDARILGVMVGVVAKNYSKDLPGRLCITLPVRDKEANELKWARLAMPASGKKWGYYFMPEIGDQVLVVFENGNIEKPFVIGCVPKDTDTFISQSVDENNQNKRIVTKNGNSITFTDNKEGEGEKDKIEIKTAKDKHFLLLDNENKKMMLEDKEKKCLIEMDTENGAMKVVAKGSINIEVGDKIKIKLNGDTGEIKIDANKLKVEASEKIELASSSSAKLTGATTTIEASSSLSLNSSAVCKIAGTPVKIG